MWHMKAHDAFVTVIVETQIKPPEEARALSRPQQEAPTHHTCDLCRDAPLLAHHQHHVVRFQVRMDDALAVQVLETLGDARHHLHVLEFGKGTQR